MNMSKIYCAHTDVAATDSLIENPRNPNRHPEDQIIALAKIIRHQGWRNPIVVSRRSGFVVKGHGRLLAARMLGHDTLFLSIIRTTRTKLPNGLTWWLTIRLPNSPIWMRTS